MPVSSIYKIVKSMRTSLHNNRDENLDAQFSYKLNEEERQFIRGFVKPPQIPLTIESIHSELSKNFCTQSRKRDIKQYLKKSLHYSYKKGGATTFKGGTQKTNYLQSIFASKILCKIMDDKLIINIDEWVF